MSTSEEQNPQGEGEAVRAATSETSTPEVSTDAKPAETVADAKPAETVADAKPAESASDAKPAESASDAKPADAKPAEGPARPWWRRVRWGEVVLLVLAVAVVGRFAMRHRGGRLGGGDGGGGGGAPTGTIPPTQFNQPMTDDVREFLAPIAEGSAVGGATVTRISPVVRGKIHIELRKGDETVHLAIARLPGSSTAQGSGRYVVYIWDREPSAVANQVSYALSSALRSYGGHTAPAGLEFGEH